MASSPKYRASQGEEEEEERSSSSEISARSSRGKKDYLTRFAPESEERKTLIAAPPHHKQQHLQQHQQQQQHNKHNASSSSETYPTTTTTATDFNKASLNANEARAAFHHETRLVTAIGTRKDDDEGAWVTSRVSPTHQRNNNNKDDIDQLGVVARSLQLPPETQHQQLSLLPSQLPLRETSHQPRLQDHPNSHHITQPTTSIIEGQTNFFENPRTAT